MRDTTTTLADGTRMVTVTNGHARELLAAYELPAGVLASEFPYVDASPENDGSDDSWSPRFFRYRGSWFDVNDTPRAEGEIARAGWDGFASDTYFSGIAIRYAGAFDSVVVASVAFL